MALSLEKWTSSAGADRHRSSATEPEKRRQLVGTLAARGATRPVAVARIREFAMSGSVRARPVAFCVVSQFAETANV